MFISIEGADGAGKTTQAALLVGRLKAAGYAVTTVREPGGTAVGEALRQVLKGGGEIGPLAELLMFEAARAELVQKVIRPALSRGELVVADRFSDSSVAYQAFGRGMPVSEVEGLNKLASGGLRPDLTVLLDIGPDAARARSASRDRGGARPRFETESVEFHVRVIDGYRTLAAQETGRWSVVDGTGTEKVVAEAVWARIAPRLSGVVVPTPPTPSTSSGRRLTLSE